MTNTTRLLIAVALTLVLAVGAVSVWAGSARQGTTPIFPEEFTGSCGKDQTINFGTGTVTADGTCDLTVTVSPEPEEAGALPDGWTGLFDYVTVTTDGSLHSVEICVPFSPDWAGKKAGDTLNWFVWADGKWTQLETYLKDGNPQLLCAKHTKAGIFTVLGK